MSALRGIVIFTVVETVTLVLWLVLAGLRFEGHVLAVVVLAIGLLLEHVAAYNVGMGRPLFSLPR